MRTIKTCLAVVAGALLLSGCHGGNRPDSAAVTSATGSSPAPATGVVQPATTPVAGSTTTKTVAKTIGGTLFYTGNDFSEDSSLYTLRGNRLKTVLRGDAVVTVEASPGGPRLAYVLGNGDLMVANADGTKARKLRSDAVTAGFGPTWSGDGNSVVIARETGPQAWQAGTVRVADNRFTALPKSIQGNIHYRLTGDGTRYFYANGRCTVFSARTDGAGITKVPGLGLDTDSATNPRRLRACDIISLNGDGGRMTVDLHVGNQTDGDILGSQHANAVIDTATGRVLPLPVHGTVSQALYLRDGTLLVRSGSPGKAVLTLLSPSLRVLATKAEPASVKGLVLRDYAP